MSNKHAKRRLPRAVVDLTTYDDVQEMDLSLHYSPVNYKLQYSYSPDSMDDISLFARLTDEYFDICKDKDDPHPPNAMGLCNHLGIYSDNFYSYINGTYVNGNPKGLKLYQSICKAAHQAFGAGLIDGGLTKKYNPQITMMILSSKYDYGKTDTLNVNLTVAKDTSTMSNEELTAELESLQLKRTAIERASIEVEYTELEPPDTD
jgi:hypothetical protein